jgi:hypothetical protein
MKAEKKLWNFVVLRILSPERPNMRSNFYISLILLFIPFSAFTQSDSSIIRIEKTNSSYKTALYYNDNVYAITESGHVVIWNLSTLDTILFPKNDTASYKFLCVAKDQINAVYFGTDKGHIFKYHPETGECGLYKKLKYSIHHIVFNSNNHPLVIVPYAVYDPITKKRWTEFENHTNGLILKKKVLGLFSKRIYKYLQMPQYTFLDSQDRLWMTASFGEFGGDVQIFDAKNFRILDNKFDSISPGLLCPKSVFEGTGKNIFITSGLQHFSNSGDIYRVDPDGSTTKIFHSSGRTVIDRKTNKVIDEGGLFIGPGAYNKQDDCIYFATSRGIHKIRSSQNKSEAAELVVDPALRWGREPLAIGVAMNIKRMEFLPDGRLLFLTAMDGIGMLDHGKITLLH